MLRFTCDYCGKEYFARIGTIFVVKYGTFAGADHYLHSEEDPCFQCAKRAEKAGKVELRKIKKGK